MSDARADIVELEAEHVESIAKSVTRHRKAEISPDEMTDLLHDTFAPEKDKSSDSIEVPSEEDVLNNKVAEKK